MYFSEAGLIDSEFVFIAGPSEVPIAQLPLAMLRGTPLDNEHVGRAIGSSSAQLAALGHQLSTVVLKEALAECLKSASPTTREQQW